MSDPTLPCPGCGEPARLIVSPLTRHEAVPEKQQWILTCEQCGAKTAGVFPPMTQALAIGAFLLPVAVFWGLFLLYAEAFGPPWIQFILFLFHLVPGLYLGDRWSRWIALRAAGSWERLTSSLHPGNLPGNPGKLPSDPTRKRP